MSKDGLTNDQLNDLIANTEVPAGWWNEPEGWMQKPDFKRKEQIPGKKSDGFGKGLMSAMKKAYSWRWWQLDTEGGKFLRYFKDQNAEAESGSVDLSTVTSITVSVIGDAPHNAIDLNSPTNIYTIASDTQEEMIRWAKVLNAGMEDKYEQKSGGGGGGMSGSQTVAENETRESEVPGAHAGEEFSVDFATKESLFMSLEGLSTYTIVVTGFVKRPDGSKGQAESSGKIQEDDYLIGVNDINLEEKTFFDSIAEIQKAEWPMTLHFRRTAADDGEDVEFKGWVLMKEPNNDKFFRRFLQLSGTELSYFKPAYGGRQSTRHGFIDLSKLKAISQAKDMRATEKLQIQMKLVCEDGDWMICVRDDSDLGGWVEKLGAADGVEVGELVLTEASKEEALAGAAHSGVLKKQSELDPSSFAERFFVLRGAELSYHKSSGSRRLGMVDLHMVKSMQPIKVTNSEDGLQHRLCLIASQDGASAEQVLNLATGDEAAIAVWKEKLESCFKTLGETCEIKVLEEIEDDGASAAAAGGEDDDEDALDDDEEKSPNLTEVFNQFGVSMQKVQGWMYKKGDVTKVIDSRVLGIKALGMRNSTYRRRFFVLQQAELCYYRTRAQSLEGTPTGVIPLRRVTDVKWSSTTWAENGIDLVTPKRLYTVVPETEEEATVWFDALVEAVDMLADSTDDSSLPPDEEAAAGKLAQEIKESLSHSGALQKLTGNRLTGLTSWKKRFFALQGAVLSYYEQETDLYNEDVDALGTVNMNLASKIKSSNHPEVEWKRAFEVTVGERTFVLLADDAEGCVQWMVAIAAATSGKLEMNQRADGTWESTNPKAQLSKRMATYGAGAKKRATRGRRSSTKKRASMNPVDITSPPVAEYTPTE